MSAHPELIPSYVSQEELARDRELRADLLEKLHCLGVDIRQVVIS